mmetsp:Transcript_3037/g.12271  ORF Transcript_3037/g.12271 Transcript_3037/m.12271 type:complete len:263 (-) Transcript_3037:609-1397(-)
MCLQGSCGLEQGLETLLEVFHVFLWAGLDGIASLRRSVRRLAQKFLRCAKQLPLGRTLVGASTAWLLCPLEQNHRRGWKEQKLRGDGFRGHLHRIGATVVNHGAMRAHSWRNCNRHLFPLTPGGLLRRAASPSFCKGSSGGGGHLLAHDYCRRAPLWQRRIRRCLQLLDFDALLVGARSPVPKAVIPSNPNTRPIRAMAFIRRLRARICGLRIIRLGLRLVGPRSPLLCGLCLLQGKQRPNELVDNAQATQTEASPIEPFLW